VGEAFHAALHDTERPAFLDRRTHPWSVGDRAAWGEIPSPVTAPAFGSVIDRLFAFLRPVDLPSQVIHGDLTGNVLLADGLAPAVIDFSPYFRPSGYGLGVIIVDAIAWYGATHDLVGQADHVPCLDQLVARAAIYRLVTAAVVAPSQLPGWAATQIAAHLPILELLGA
jgi:uncharacterized protein (TIGR02569 family)